MAMRASGDELLCLSKYLRTVNMKAPALVFLKTASNYPLEDIQTIWWAGAGNWKQTNFWTQFLYMAKEDDQSTE